MLSYFSNPANVASLTSLLAYHIVPEYVELTNLLPGQHIQTAEGGDVTVVYIEGVVRPLFDTSLPFLFSELFLHPAALA